MKQWPSVLIMGINIKHLTAKLFDCNFNPTEVVFRWRDPQLQVGKN